MRVALQYDFTALEEMLSKLHEANDSMISNNIADNPYTDVSANEVVMSYDNIRNSAGKFADEVARILSAAEGTGLTDEEVTEMQSVFKNFDKGEQRVRAKRGKLGLDEAWGGWSANYRVSFRPLLFARTLDVADTIAMIHRPPHQTKATRLVSRS